MVDLFKLREGPIRSFGQWLRAVLLRHWILEQVTICKFRWKFEESNQKYCFSTDCLQQILHTYVSAILVYITLHPFVPRWHSCHRWKKHRSYYSWIPRITWFKIFKSDNPNSEIHMNCYFRGSKNTFNSFYLNKCPSHNNFCSTN